MLGTLKEVLEQKTQMNKRDKDCVTKPQTPRARCLQCSRKEVGLGSVREYCVIQWEGH